jgi:hypothetical protein
MNSYILIKERIMYKLDVLSLFQKIEIIIEGLFYNSNNSKIGEILETFELCCFLGNANKSFIKDIYELSKSIQISDLNIDQLDNGIYHNETLVKIDIHKWFNIVNNVINELNIILKDDNIKFINSTISEGWN